MDPLDFLTDRQLMTFFHRKKTEISCIEEPHTFLSQLRDHNLVPEKLYQQVIRTKNKEKRRGGVYDILDWLEKERGQFVKRFFSCVFQDHILQKYPVLRLLRNSLMDGSFNFHEQLPDREEPNRTEKEAVQEQETKIKGGRRRKKSVEETEEEEEPGPSSCSTPTRKKPTRRPTFCSPLKKGEKAEIWTWDLYKTSLPVTCGDKEGTLHRGKLAKGVKCIYSGHQWFTPGGFEKFAGKEKTKNWKFSIRCQNTPLQKLLQENHLQSPRMKRQRARKRPVSSSGSSSPESGSSTEIEESSDDQEEDREEEEEENVRGEENEQNREEEEENVRGEDNEQNREEEEENVRGEDNEQNREEEEENVRGEDNEQNREEEEESEPVDLSEFTAAVLPVCCGSLTGDLHKKRFAGPRSMSIRTEERWFTPEGFVKQEFTSTDGHWKKDILCHGKTLDYLVKKEILFIHSLLCNCDHCCPKDPLALNNDDLCFICDSDGDEDEELTCCDECPRVFHTDCHLPPPDDTSADTWICTFCVWRINQQMLIHMSLEDALNSPVTQQSIMHCQYLLLFLYKEDRQRVFTDDPITVPGYRSVTTTNPMWLNRVKAKLQGNKYSTVREFVDDIRLIFQNCQTFNRDNEFGIMGARLSEIFEQKVHIVFKIQ